MRKIIAAVLAVFLLFCVGCSKPVKANLRGISFDFTLQNGENSVEVNAVCAENGDMLFSVRGGDIDGLKVRFSEDKIQTELASIVEEFKGDTDFGVLSAIYKAFAGLHNTEAEQNDGEYVLELDLENAKGTLILTELGLPIKLILGQTEIQLNNLKVI